MNPIAAYVITTERLASLRAEAEHERLAREAAAARRGALKDVAARLGRALREPFPAPALPRLSNNPYRS